MCCILKPEMAHGRRQMLSAKWVERDGITIAVSPADECVHLLSDPTRLNGIKSKGMRAMRKGRALVMQNNYMTYTMTDVPPLPDYMVVLPKGQLNGIRAHYNIRTDPDLGMGLQGSTPKTVGAARQHHRAATLCGEQGLQIVAKLRGCKQLEDCCPRAKDGGGQESGA